MAVRLWQVVAQYTYIYSASDHEFLPNGTRRGPWVVAVDNDCTPPRGHKTNSIPADAFHCESTALADPAAYSKAHIPATIQTHRNTLAQL